ncbi:MAG: hypothetical protein JXR61_08965, partial [Prolixibacteraceae bacterium]|nr:hypothetical protein [Prolixibacteraceae bacterium]
SFLLNNLMRYVYLYRKYRMQPFNNRSLLVILIFGVAFGLGFILPQITLVWDILIRSTVFSIFFLLLTYFMKVSEDANKTINEIFTLSILNFKKMFLK